MLSKDERVGGFFPKMTMPMPTITAIERQKRRPRVDLYVDGAFAVTLGLDLVTEHSLRVGDAFPDERRRVLEAEGRRREATAAALSLLARGPRSEKDLRDRLRRRALPKPAVDAAV